MEDEQQKTDNVDNSAQPEELASDQNEDQAEEAVVAGVEAVGRVALFFNHIKQFFITVWKTPKYRYGTIATVLLLIVVLAAIPTTRWGALNTLGFRANAQILVVDEASQLPLKDVIVNIGSIQASTDEQGSVYLEDVRLGGSELRISKSAYADIVRSVDIGFGSNEIGQESLKPIGTSFDFTITNWLSGEPIERATVVYQESSVFSNDKGEAILTVPPTDSRTLSVSVTAEGFADAVVEIDGTLDELNEVELVSSEKNYYISRGSGTYDVFKSNLDGSDPELVVQGTGNEGANTRFSVSPSNAYGALVSTRNNIEREQIDYEYDYITPELHVIDLQSSELVPVTTSERIELVGWVKDNLVYVEISAGASRYNAERTQLKSFNSSTRQTNDLAVSNYFQDVRLVGERVFYAPGLSDKQKEPQEYLYAVSYLGGEPEIILNKSTRSIRQSDLQTISIETYDEQERESDFFTYGLSTGEISDASRLSNDNYYYQTSQDGTNTATIAVRDGKGVLLVSRGGEEQTTLISKAGAKLPLRWIGSNMIVFRVSNSDGTADYVIDVRGGDAQKVRDVTDVPGSDLWYYYRGL